jgi:hypothetical protein
MALRFGPSSLAALGVALCVSAGTAWMDLFTAYRVARFGDEVWATMAGAAFVLSFGWFSAERGARTDSALAFVLRSIAYSMACSALAAAAWVCRPPVELRVAAIAHHALEAALVAVVAAMAPVWCAPLLCVLIVLGAPLWFTQRARRGRSLSLRDANAIVAAFAAAASAVFAALAWTDRLPSALFSTSYAPTLARVLSLSALVLNATIALEAVARRARAMR